MFIQPALSVLLSAMLSLSPIMRVASPQAVHACGPITTDTTWTTGNVVVCSLGVRVAAGVTLTIQPGVVVMAEQFAGLAVEGRLMAHGTAAQPILMTGVNNTPGYWAGVDIGSYLVLTASASASFNYVTIEYGGASGGENLELIRSTLEIANSTVRHSGKHGLFVGAGSRLHSHNLRLNNNGVGAEGYPLILDNLDIEDTAFDGIEMSGNGLQAVRLGGGMVQANQRWEALGVPYRVNGSKSIAANATLSIDPGVELQFEPFAGLTVLGVLQAIGEPQRPITLTGVNKQPGAWLGVHLAGSPDNEAAANLEYVTIEYGGGFLANLSLLLGRAVARHTVLRHSSQDGARVGAVSALTLEASQITDNTGYGVNMDATAEAVIASNNWWGAASGPMADGNCNVGGTGSRISSDVIFRPFLTSANQQPDPFATGDTSLITLTPSKWFEEVSNSRALTMNLNLRDGSGNPLPNRKVQFASGLNVIEGDAMTDANGNARGRLTLMLAGENIVTASLLRGQCESGRSAKTRVNITQPITSTSPLADGAAPYLSSNIRVEPLPIIKGITTHLSVNFKNPFTVPITLYVQIGYASAGVGVPFEPITFTPNITVGPTRTVVIELDWVPPVGGHICIEVRYAYLKPGDPPPPGGGGGGGSGIGSIDGVGAPPGQTGARQFNFAILAGVFKNLQTGAYIQALKTLYKYYDSVGLVIEIAAISATAPEFIPFLLLQDQVMSNATDFLFDKLSHLSCRLQASPDCDSSWNGPRWQVPAGELGNLFADPPSQDYRILVAPDVITLPPAVPSDSVPAARAAAINALAEAQLKATTHLVAAIMSFDRAAGAAEAQDLIWHDAHMTAYLMYLGQTADWMLLTADRLEALIAELTAEGYTDLRMNPTTFAAYQQRLLAQGFTAQEKAAAYLVGLDDVGLEAIRASRLAEDASTKTTSLFGQWRAVAAGYRQMAHHLKGLPAFAPISAAPLSLRSNAEGKLARVYDTSTSFTIGNPYTRPITLNLSLRRVSLPADWIASVSPITATLAPSATLPATLTLVPGAAMPQGARVRVAIEGTADGQLVGGYVVEVWVPRRVTLFFQRVYLPLLRK